MIFPFFVPMNQQGEPPTGEKLINLLRVITLALVSGPTVFLGIVAYLILNTNRGASPSLEQADTFLAITLALCVGLSLLAKPLADRMRTSCPSPEIGYQNSVILRMALAEAPALAGMVFLLIVAPGLDLQEHPKLALFLIPYLSLLVTAAFHFPSGDKLEDFKTDGIR